MPFDFSSLFGGAQVGLGAGIANSAQAATQTALQQSLQGGIGQLAGAGMQGGLQSLLNPQSLQAILTGGINLYGAYNQNKLMNKQIDIANANESRNRQAWDNQEASRVKRASLHF